MKLTSKEKDHWYFTEINHCPYCERENRDKVRQYSPKPKEKSKRVQYNTTWCGFCTVNYYWKGIE